MPVRQFVGTRVKEARESLKWSQANLAERLKVSRGAVAGWETERDRPAPERFPEVARVLGMPLNKLFPRKGEPDLADTRCDAGYSQIEASRIIGVVSPTLSNAERGARRLPRAYVKPLADLYGVTVGELLAAQERSFGNHVPVPSAGTVSTRDDVPRTLAEKITYLLDKTFPGGPPSDREVANAINATTDHQVIDDNGVRALRTGTVTSVQPAVLAGLAEFFQVQEAFFAPNDDVTLAVTEAIALLTRFRDLTERNNSIKILAARGGNAGELPPEALAMINRVVADFRQRQTPDSGGGGSPCTD